MAAPIMLRGSWFINLVKALFRSLSITLRHLIFKWLRDRRFSSAPDPGVDFLPVTLTADPDPPPLKISRPPVPAPADVRVEITTPGG